jgi:hypothetical protein
MKKCTLCIDKIYNETLDEADRVPACVATCPVSARHFGDLGNPESDVSKLVAERAGYALMPELGYKPVNRYLPPRPRKTEAADSGAPAKLCATPSTDAAHPLLHWIDRVLSRAMHPAFSVSCSPPSRSHGLLFLIGLLSVRRCCPAADCSGSPAWPFSGWSPPHFISVAPNALGGPFRNGGRRGCRERACSPSRFFCPPAFWESPGCSSAMLLPGPVG